MGSASGRGRLEHRRRCGSFSGQRARSRHGPPGCCYGRVGVRGASASGRESRKHRGATCTSIPDKSAPSRAQCGVARMRRRLAPAGKPPTDYWGARSFGVVLVGRPSAHARAWFKSRPRSSTFNRGTAGAPRGLTRIVGISTGAHACLPRGVGAPACSIWMPSRSRFGAIRISPSTTSRNSRSIAPS